MLFHSILLNFLPTKDAMIPVINCYGDIIKHGNEIFEAISTVGFVYLTNFGMNELEVAQLFNVGKAFFDLPDCDKILFSRPKDYATEGNSGYVAPNVEILNPQSLAELREAFNYRPNDTFKLSVDNSIPNFHSTLDKFCQLCFDVSLKLLYVFAVNLNLEDKDFFAKCHHQDKSATTLRLLHYPALPHNIPPGAVRCGEHSDYGSITLLFQDDIGGLEVLRRDGHFIQAKPVPGAVLINTGDLMQRWSSDRVAAVRHRVLIPEDETLKTSERYSMAYFVHPDDDFIVKPLDGSKSYDPVGAREHLLKMFSKTY